MSVAAGEMLIFLILVIVDASEKSTSMKLRMAFSALVLSLPGLASADLALSSAALGQVEGILSFCSQKNPKLASIKESPTMFVGKATADELAQARKSDEYKSAYELIAAELAKLDEESGTKACAGFVDSK